MLKVRGSIKAKTDLSNARVGHKVINFFLIKFISVVYSIDADMMPVQDESSEGISVTCREQLIQL